MPGHGGWHIGGTTCNDRAPPLADSILNETGQAVSLPPGQFQKRIVQKQDWNFTQTVDRQPHAVPLEVTQRFGWHAKKPVRQLGQSQGRDHLFTSGSGHAAQAQDVFDIRGRRLAGPQRSPDYYMGHTSSDFARVIRTVTVHSNNASHRPLGPTEKLAQPCLAGTTGTYNSAHFTR